MQDSNALTVRGIGIAVVILSALALIVFGLGAIAVGALGAFVSDPSLYGDGISINGYDHGYYDSLSAEEAAGLMSGSMPVSYTHLNPHGRPHRKGRGRSGP